jgi:hypothetical protein
MINIIPNQPLAQRLQYINRHITDRELMQHVQADDVQRLQVQRGIVGSRSVLGHTAFTKTGGITGSGNTLTASGAGTATGNSGISGGNAYEVRYVVAFSAIDNTGGYRIKLNNVYLPMPDASAGAYSILSGTITLYYNVASLTTSDLVFETTGADTELTISGISVTQLTTVRCDILDENFDVLDSNPFTITTYADNNLADISVDWSQCSSNGTRYLHVAANTNFNSELFSNPTFTTDILGWTAENGASTDWVWNAANGGEARWAGAVAPNSTLSQEVTVPGGSQYTLEFTATGLAANGSESILVRAVVNSTDQVLSTSVFLNGTNTVDIDLSAYENTMVALRVTFEPGGVLQTVGCSGASIKRTLDLQGITVPCRVLTTQLNTHIMYATNTGSAFGLDFTGYFMKLRLKARKEYTKYTDTTDMAAFSDNSNDLTLSYPEKVQTITVYGAPEYLHDAIRLMRLCDTFQYDGEDYVQAGEYAIRRTEYINQANAQFDVKDKVSVERNTYSNA